MAESYEDLKPSHQKVIKWNKRAHRTVSCWVCFALRASASAEEGNKADEIGNLTHRDPGAFKSAGSSSFADLDHALD